MKEILKFNYKDYQLCLYYGNKKAYYAKKINGKLNFNVSLKEISLIKFFYKKVMPSSHLSMKYTLAFNKGNYMLFEDNENKVCLFYELKDNRLEVPKLAVRKKLNYLLNNQNEYASEAGNSLEIASSKKDDNKFFKRIVRIGKRIVVVLVASSIVLGYDYIEQKELAESKINIEEVFKDYNLEEIANSLVYDPESIDEEKQSISTQEEFRKLAEKIYQIDNLQSKDILINYHGKYIVFSFDMYGHPTMDFAPIMEILEPTNEEVPKEIKKLAPQYSMVFVTYKDFKLTYDDMTRLISYNKNLTPSEKEYVLSNRYFIESNLKYMDPIYIYQMLVNLDIVYNTDELSSEYVSGNYDGYNYEIIVGDGNIDDCNESTLSHELCHSFSSSSKNFDSMFEIINAIINNEYFSKKDTYTYDFGYYLLMPRGFILTELLGPEVVKQAYFKKDKYIIKDALLKIIDDENLAGEILDNMNMSVVLYKQISQLSLIAQQDLKELDSRFMEIISIYYQAKYQKSIEENEEMMFNFHELTQNGDFIEPLAKKILTDENAIKHSSSTFSVLYHKHYFNEKYFGENNKTTLVFCQNIEFKENYVLDQELIDYFISIGDIVVKDGKYFSNADYIIKKDDGTFVNVSAKGVNEINYTLNSGPINNELKR